MTDPRARGPIQWIPTSFQNISLRVTNSVTSVSDRIRKYFNPPPPVFDDEEIDEFMNLTYLSKEEILRCYTHFVSMQPQFFDGEKNPYLPRYKVMGMPEFKVNPFRERMMSQVTSYEDFLTFEDYLEMMSIFSEQAPIELKAEYIFRIYDFDFDDAIGAADLINVVKILIDFDQEMSDDEIEKIAYEALFDGDLDGDGVLVFAEFIHLVKRMEDFKSSFTIRI